MCLRPSPVEFEVPYEGRYGGPVHHQRQHDHSSSEENDPVFVHLFDGVHTCWVARQNDARERIVSRHVMSSHSPNERPSTGWGGPTWGISPKRRRGGGMLGRTAREKTPPFMYIPECYSPVLLYTRGASSVVGVSILLSQGGSCLLNDYCADSRPNNQTLWVGTGTVLPEQGCPRTTRSKLSKQWQQQPPRWVRVGVGRALNELLWVDRPGEGDRSRHVLKKTLMVSLQIYKNLAGPPDKLPVRGS